MSGAGVGRIALVVASTALALGTGCGARSAADDRTAVVASTRTAEQEPRDTRISIETQKTGASVQVDVTGRGLRYRAGEAFERSDRWHVAASADGVPLRRLLNGPARVERRPTDGDDRLWDVTVAFSVAFAVPEGTSSIDVVVAEPGGRTANRHVGL